jgi:hypothetical protein
MLGGILLALAAATVPGPAQPPAQWLTSKQAHSVVERLAEREPFLASIEARTHPETLGRFFGKREYESLRGNPILGFWQDEGFKWVGQKVRWRGIVAAGDHRTAAITTRAWDAAFRHVARKYGLAIERRAPMVITGACVAAVLEPGPEEPNRGVVLEIRVDGPGGAFLYRFGYGNPTLEGAVGGSVDLAVFLARRFGGAGR